MLSEMLDQLERLQAQEIERKKEIAELRKELKDVKGQLASVLSSLGSISKLQETIASSLLSQGSPLPKPTQHQQQDDRQTQNNEIELDAEVRPVNLVEGSRDEEGGEEVSVVSGENAPGDVSRMVESSDEEEIVVDETPAPATRKRKAPSTDVGGGRPTPFQRIGMNRKTMTAANQGLFDDFRAKKIVPFLTDLAMIRPGINSDRKNPLNIKWAKPGQGGRENIKVRRSLNMLMNDLCKSKEEYELLAGVVPPVYGDQNREALQQRSDEAKAMAEAVAKRATDWVNDNRKNEKEKKIDGSANLLFGTFVARVDRIPMEEKKMYNKWNASKTRPTAAAIAAAEAAAAEEGEDQEIE